MSIINVGDIPINENLVDGTELARRLERLYAAFHSQNSSATRPPYVTAGGIWSNTVTNGFEVKLFDGVNDVKLGDVINGLTVLNAARINAFNLDGDVKIFAGGGDGVGNNGGVVVSFGNDATVPRAQMRTLGYQGVLDLYDENDILRIRFRAKGTSYIASDDGAGNNGGLVVSYTTGSYAPRVQAHMLSYQGVVDLYDEANVHQIRLRGGGNSFIKTGNVGFGTNAPVGRVDAISNGYSAFVARSASAGAAVDVIAMKAVDSAAANFANAAYQARSHVWGINGSTLGMELDNSANLKFNSGYGSVATAYGCRAWVNFNGSGTVAIKSSGNVSSITDAGVGTYVVNFTNGMPDTNYAFHAACNGNGSDYRTFAALVDGTQNTGSIRILFNNQLATNVDVSSASVSIFR